MAIDTVCSRPDEDIIASPYGYVIDPEGCIFSANHRFFLGVLLRHLYGDAFNRWYSFLPVQVQVRLDANNAFELNRWAIAAFSMLPVAAVVFHPFHGTVILLPDVPCTDAQLRGLLALFDAIRAPQTLTETQLSADAARVLVADARLPAKDRSHQYRYNGKPYGHL